MSHYATTADKIMMGAIGGALMFSVGCLIGAQVAPQSSPLTVEETVSDDDPATVEETVSDDDPAFDCVTTGNEMCGVVVGDVTYVITFRNGQPINVTEARVW